MLTSYQIDVLFIPRGLTYMLQPLDVFINKPMKDKLRDKWEEYMQSNVPKMNRTNTKPIKPSKELLVKWVHGGWYAMKINNNAFMDSVLHVDLSKQIEEQILIMKLYWRINQMLSIWIMTP